MDKEEQYLLFALSTPMEVLYIGNELRIPLQQCIPEFLLSISPIHGGLITVKILFKPSIG